MDELKRTWANDGLVVLPGLVDATTVERHIERVASIRAQVPNGVDENGLGDRIGQLHQKVPELMGTVDSPRLLSFIRYALEDDPVLFASLNFDRGTQQGAHVDLIYFCTEPLHSMVGVWIALEDIDLDAGPLFYHLGSHKWPFEYFGEVDEDVAAGSALADKERIAARATSWLDRLGRRIKERASMPKPMILRKGDAVVWHARLAHGGMPRLDLKRSRRSVVYHFVGASSRLYTYEDFFTLPREQLLAGKGVDAPVRTRGEIRYQHYPNFVTYDGGEELVHRLDE
jgi:ectoine hydroxylase-related dioxygenase (phytanoyl-CoA dioxygenase family)